MEKTVTIKQINVQTGEEIEVEEIIEINEEEILKQELQAKIMEAKQYLTDTGWVWEKYNRNVLVLKDMTSDEFNLKYSDVISKQEEARALINGLETQLEVING